MLPLLVNALVRFRLLGTEPKLQPLLPPSTGITVYAAAGQAYRLIAVCIAFSIVVHSSTDVPVARMFHVSDLVGIPDGDEAVAKGVENTADIADEPRGTNRART